VLRTGACLQSDVQRIIHAGSWYDPRCGGAGDNEQKADIIFQIAGGTGVGVFQAALELGHYAIGVDSDQAVFYVDDQPDLANRILTSMMKNVGFSLYRAVDLHLKGELPYGTEEQLGIVEGGIGL
jgi:basic membrane protein A